MSSYQENRRADRAAERTQDREDRRLELEAKLAAQAQREKAEQEKAEQKAEQARKDAEAKRRQKQQEGRARRQERDRKKAARRAKVAKVTRWLNANPVTAFVAFVMVCSIVPAVISQVGALADAKVNVFLAALLSAMLEGTAWALTFMGKNAEDAGRPAGKYRVATWCTAFLAAGVNYWHWAAVLPADLWVAVVFASSSLIAIYLWDMKTHGSHGKTKQERQEEKARREHLAARRKHHKDVAKQADRIMSAVPHGTYTEDEVWEAAWRIEYGTEPGMTPDLYSQATAARVELQAAIDIAHENRPELIRAGLLTGLTNPLPHRLAEGIPTLGAVSPIPSLPKGSEAPTALAGIGMYGSEDASEKAREKGSEKASRNAGGNARKGRSDEELKTLLPEGLKAAADLVAEGGQISAAALSKRLGIRRDDARRLRDLVVAERKLKLVDGAVVGA
ncbi:DUF2637 domain-containing protein [Streptomyces albidoflavus]|uniref:DUF2637 domain-containing protein n=1 Tax=Streptomyces albidoflavus TaxID=1886 RepID=UPI00101E24A1|nr:DUF2637 domain-containing protein [Streptomyces albidoflavus]RZD77143.1 hypothetical protein C0Q63_31880 [Streptomyces albidoflavus]